MRPITFLILIATIALTQSWRILYSISTIFALRSLIAIANRVLFYVARPYRCTCDSRRGSVKSLRRGDVEITSSGAFPFSFLLFPFLFPVAYSFHCHIVNKNSTWCSCFDSLVHCACGCSCCCSCCSCFYILVYLVCCCSCCRIPKLWLLVLLMLPLLS